MREVVLVLFMIALRCWIGAFCVLGFWDCLIAGVGNGIRVFLFVSFLTYVRAGLLRISAG